MMADDSFSPDAFSHDHSAQDEDEDEARRRAAREHIAEMFASDRVRTSLGLDLVSVGPGAATMQLRVGPTMVNGHGLCHGGYLFTLADSAAAYAVNAMGTDAVASSASIEFLAPGREGELLTASAFASAKAGRRHVLDVTVTGEDGRILAVFRGVATELRR